ncbi:Mus7/MMS22 family-domain-containing protein [Hypoxylon crocopeplum]|nr:Mus7/MMS22 family-domain-containing protein [Hypoxylon crocopeplum]
MAKWKELGEVPDSEDESDFDSSQEDEHDLPQPRSGAGTPERLAAEVPPPKDQNIWDIPLSSQSPGKGRGGDRGLTKPPRPLTEPETIRDLDSSPLSSPLLVPIDDLETPIQIAEFNRTQLDSPERPEAAPTVSPWQFDDAIFDGEDVLDENEESTEQGAVQLGRSLRPRKPIQEHPYLLESAQYSKTLKSHGVRPLRMQAEEAARRKRQEEDSQEQEYEEQSQSTAKEVVQEYSGESQEIQHPGLLDDIDEEDIAPTGTPAGSPSPSPERGGAQPDIFLRSSQNDEEEFPDPADIDKWKLKKRPAAITKRQASPRVSKKRKLLKLHQPVRFAREASPLAVSGSIFDIPPSPPQTSPNFPTVTPVTAIRRSNPVTTLTPKLSSAASSQNQSPAPAIRITSMIDLTMVEDEDETGDEQGTGSSSNSESETETARVAMRRKIRGVLPASWLRLDRQGTRQRSARALPQRSPDHSPERIQRKGLAQRRQTSPKPGNGAALFLDDSDDDTILRIDDFNETHRGNDPGIPIFEDDAGSVVEDDHIDYMLSGHKRASTDADGAERPRKRRKSRQTMFKGQPGQPSRQQRITGLLNRTKGRTTESNAELPHVKYSLGGGRQTRELGRMPATSTPAPQLSILDVVEPNAPPFIRIAARTANKRSDKGRSSPSRKQIALGTRKDNIDAIGVLRDWKGGRIQPRNPSSVPTKSTQSPRPLRLLSHNSIAQAPKAISRPRPRRVVPSSLFSQPHRPAKQASMDNFVTGEAEMPPTHAQPSPTVSLSKRSQAGRAKSYNSTSRPAQLEIAGEQVGRHAFHARKKALDALYRKSRRALPGPSSIGLERLISSVPVESPPRRVEDLPSGDNTRVFESAPARRRLKLRKHFRPQHVDTTAPKYAHANDPVPYETSPASPIVEVTPTSEFTGKLLGLGPFGTHYTQHFEVFPLDFGVFFHEGTLLGSGRLVKALNEKPRDSLHRPRGHSTFVLDEKLLRWGQWDDQTSSEFGIVFDWIVDYPYSEPPDLSSRVNPVQAAEFALDYLQEYVSFADKEGERHFISRALEILRSFAERLEALPTQARDRARPLVDVLSRCLIISFQILRICHNLCQLSEIFQLEEVLKKIAKRTARELLETELVDIRNLYHDLQRMPFRERGIRNEHYSIACWVILIRVLEEAHILRSGFWDVVSSAMLDTDPSSISDAHTFERIWYNLFTLLPLGEFDNTGVLVPGMRNITPLEDWTLPQKLLRRVFQLYESNSRQAPSFNDYCRGIVSRCHYLVEQWGWRKSNGIIGTIFDFFASRGLAHLRNEEVYRSPEFLEHLAETPSLAIVPEDRCFHIFLKLLALSIKRLGSLGLTKDARNMLARVLPNHNRQYDKEKDIHESELAALRNHHDLLCTLFWAAPPSLRPSVQTIEKLVSPSSSHKEACLISLRAWSQLSRFVISSDADTNAYKPFADWQKTIFQQVMEQYLSAESDIQQQLSKMSKDASRNISQDMVNAVIKLNRKGAMDILHFSMKGFLSVIRHAPTLSAASFALNYYQLDQVFTRFPFSSADFDWSSLRVAFDILDYYVTRVEEFLKQGHVETDISWHGDDAIILLERKMAVPFFSMTRTVAGMDFRDDGLGPTSDRAICMEQAVALAGRLAARLIHARLSRTSQFCTSGKYNIFQNMPKVISSPSRKYYALFLTTLIEQGIDDFKDLGGTILDLFLMELVKPFRFLAYENRLALIIKRRGDRYLKNAAIEVGNSPDYNSNRDLFSHTVAMMRKALRFAEGGQKQQLQLQFSKALKATMDQMKLDLKSITPDSPEHSNYIDFIRSIVTVIRSQDLCPVDPYFYQISREYSPSSQDPRLQIAGILSWGLKLEEGDSKAVPGLFYLLFPNFKLALANGKLADERVILQRGMGNPHVLSFMLSRMFPAIIRTAVRAPEAWILLHTYVDAFEALLTEPCIPRAIGREDMDGLLVLLDYIIHGVQWIYGFNYGNHCCELAHIITQIVRLLNLLLPSFTAYLINEPMSPVARSITEAMEAFTDFARPTAGRLGTMVKYWAARDEERSDNLRWMLSHIASFDTGSPPESNEHVNRFANHMVQDIKENWVSDGSAISVRGPSRAQGNPGTQFGQGTLIPRYDQRSRVGILVALLRRWTFANDQAAMASRQTLSGIKRMPFDDFVF